MPDVMMTVMTAWVAFNALLAMMLGLALLAKRRVRDDGGASREALYERTARQEGA